MRKIKLLESQYIAGELRSPDEGIIEVDAHDAAVLIAHGKAEEPKPAPNTTTTTPDAGADQPPSEKPAEDTKKK